MMKANLRMKSKEMEEYAPRILTLGLWIFVEEGNENSRVHA